ELVEAHANDWIAARAAAEATFYLGNQGHLATITSAEENDFIGAALLEGASHRMYWLGGIQPTGSVEPDRNWQWITGEAWSFENWKTGEPNDAQGQEDVLQIYAHVPDYPEWFGQWNDAYEYEDSVNLGGYIVEYVPEPATLSFLAIGIGALAARRRTSK
ncbi:MAG: PEP-CTERM sorting domain-containing protein, partial [Planctomycetes bacterium]|nr:PEP-CTERM sorting domain-containing protein [Planctomycetota bacterium]